MNQYAAVETNKNRKLIVNLVPYEHAGRQVHQVVSVLSAGKSQMSSKNAILPFLWLRLYLDYCGNFMKIEKDM